MTPPVRMAVAEHWFSPQIRKGNIPVKYDKGFCASFILYYSTVLQSLVVSKHQLVYWYGLFSLIQMFNKKWLGKLT